MDSSGGILGTLVLIAIALGIVLLVLWIVLPFAVFSARGLLRELLAEQRMTNQLLRETQRGRSATADPPER